MRLLQRRAIRTILTYIELVAATVENRVVSDLVRGEGRANI